MPKYPEPGRLERALSERIYLLGPAPCADETARSFLVSGQSGKVYTTTLHIAPSTAAPRCNCPDQLIRKTVCKHLLFVGARVLKLGRASLSRPRLTAEQAERYSGTSAALAAAGMHAAPEVLRDSVARVLGPLSATGETKRVEARVPEEDEECGVCFERLCAEKVVHCGYGCGRAVHADCFERYVRATSGPARCIMCRAAWSVPKSGGGGGRRGFLAGRRLVDLSEHVPEAFVERVVVGRSGGGRGGRGRKRGTRDGRKVGTSGRKGAGRAGAGSTSGSTSGAGSMGVGRESGVGKRGGGRRTRTSSKTGKIVGTGTVGVVTRSAARRGNGETN